MDPAEMGVERDCNFCAFGGRGGVLLHFGGRDGAHLLHFMTEQIGLAERRLYRPQNLEDTDVQCLDRRTLASHRAVAVVRTRGTQMQAFADLERTAEIGVGAGVLQVRIQFLAAGGDLVDQDLPWPGSVA
jgi:hypothetical protein